MQDCTLQEDPWGPVSELGSRLAHNTPNKVPFIPARSGDGAKACCSAALFVPAWRAGRTVSCTTIGLVTRLGLFAAASSVHVPCVLPLCFVMLESLLRAELQLPESGVGGGDRTGEPGMYSREGGFLLWWWWGGGGLLCFSCC